MSSGPLAVPYAITSTPVDRSYHRFVLPVGGRTPGKMVPDARATWSASRTTARRAAHRLGGVASAVLLGRLRLDVESRPRPPRRSTSVSSCFESLEPGDPGVERREALLELDQPVLGLRACRREWSRLTRGGERRLGLLGAQLGGRGLAHVVHDGAEARLEIDHLQPEAIGELRRALGRVLHPRGRARRPNRPVPAPWSRRRPPPRHAGGSTRAR